MPNSVKYFSSGMASSPVMSASSGALIAILDACLVSGFGAVTINTLVVASGVATATVSTGHGFAMFGNSGPVIAVSGATTAGLNVEWRVTSIESATVFTFACPGIPDGTATGTISIKRAPAGWEKRYSGTNKAVYARPEPASTPLLWVDDASTTAPSLRMYLDWEEVDIGTVVSTTRQGYKDSTNKGWRVIADHRAAIILVGGSATVASTGGSLNIFGDLVEFLEGDAFACLLRGATSDNRSASGFIGQTTSLILAKNYAGTSVGVLPFAQSHSSCGADFNVYNGPSKPAASTGQYHLSPIEIWETTALPRGTVPGLYVLCHAYPYTLHDSILSDIPSLPGRDFVVNGLGSSSSGHGCAIDITGPWR